MCRQEEDAGSLIQKSAFLGPFPTETPGCARGKLSPLLEFAVYLPLGFHPAQTGIPLSSRSVVVF